MKSFIQFLKESPEKTVVLSFGRFNPPHRGHKLLMDTMVHTAQQHHCEAVLFINPKQSAPKNPLHVDDKAKYIHAMAPHLKVTWDTAVKDPEEIMVKFSNKGYDHLIIVEGEDRREHMHHLIDPMMKEGKLKFHSWEFVSAGSREAETAWSATQQREAAAKNDFETFYHGGLPKGFPEHLAHECFEKTRQGMGIHEDESAWDAGKLDEADDAWTAGTMDV